MPLVLAPFGAFPICATETEEVKYSPHRVVLSLSTCFFAGVFLIPYLIFLFLLGIPLFFLEINLGQFTSQGPVQCWRMAPLFKGLGISMTIMSFFMTVYYAMLIAYAILYLVLSFRTKLDWATCGSWASISNSSRFSAVLVLRRAEFRRLPRGLLEIHHAVQLREHLQRSERPLLHVDRSGPHRDRLVGYTETIGVPQARPAVG